MERRGTNERPIKPADISWNVESKRSDIDVEKKKTMMKYLFTSCLHICISFVSVVGSDSVDGLIHYRCFLIWHAYSDSTRRDSTKQAVKASSPNIFAIFTAIARGSMLEYRPMKHPFPGTCRFRKAGKCSRNCIPFIP